ncbi:MAG: hypothetical protein IPH80_33735 [Myxococcales bacterium]|nr:hypothetical protein [Myxococcales bacterium]
MTFPPVAILDVLDRAAAGLAFPMLDNGYVYLAAIRLSLHRSATDWALVFERFGYSPRAGIPSLDVQTFASRLHRSDRAHDAFESVYPIGGGDWIDHDDGELVATGPRSLLLRGQPRPVPTAADYAAAGVELIDPERPRIRAVPLRGRRLPGRRARRRGQRRATSRPRARSSSCSTTGTIPTWSPATSRARRRRSSSSPRCCTGDVALYFACRARQHPLAPLADGGSL